MLTAETVWISTDGVHYPLRHVHRAEQARSGIPPLHLDAGTDWTVTDDAQYPHGHGPRTEEDRRGRPL